jgi:N-acetylmuramoyl-L-alanine amidase
MNKFVLIALFSTLVWACTAKKSPFKATNNTYEKQTLALVQPLIQLPFSKVNPGPYQVATTNFNLRKPNYVIIHHTAQNSCEQTLKTFTMPVTQVSAHYVICKDGTVHQMLNDYLRAWHGGVSKWGSITDINSVSIGIELDNNGTEDFAENQIGSLLTLLDTLKKNYNIPAPNFIGHSDIAPVRKQDPSTKFPWKRLAEKGFGNWYDNSLDTIPSNFNALQGLRLIGYDTKDSIAAIVAFKRHFIQSNVAPQLDSLDKVILNNLLKKY